MVPAVAGFALNLSMPLIATWSDEYRAWYDANPPAEAACKRISECDTPMVFAVVAVPIFAVFAALLIAYLMVLPLRRVDPASPGSRPRFVLWKLDQLWRSVWTLFLPLFYLVGPIDDFFRYPIGSLRALSVAAFLLLAFPLFLHRSEILKTRLS